MSMTKEGLEVELKKAHARLYEATTLREEAANRVYEAEASYKKAEALAVSEGKIEGKNETERKASRLIHLSDHVEALNQANESKRDAELGYDLAYLDWNLARELVKVAAL